MTHRAAQLIFGLTPFIIGIFIGLIFVITPLAAAKWQGASIAWCGPGATSDNAIQVLINPNVVNDSAGLQDNSDYQTQVTLRSLSLSEQAVDHVA